MHMVDSLFRLCSSLVVLRFMRSLLLARCLASLGLAWRERALLGCDGYIQYSKYMRVQGAWVHTHRVRYAADVRSPVADYSNYDERCVLSVDYSSVSCARVYARASLVPRVAVALLALHYSP